MIVKHNCSTSPVWRSANTPQKVLFADAPTSQNTPQEASIASPRDRRVLGAGVGVDRLAQPIN
jgi:hypothetical protein